MSDSWYYNFSNMHSALKMNMIEGCVNTEYIKYINDICGLYVGQLEYKNLPSKDLTSNIMRIAMLFNNNLCFYKCKGVGEWVLCQYLTGSEYNLYWKPKRVNLIALNGESIADNVPYEDIVVIRDNPLDIIPFMVISDYISRIREIDASIFKVLKIASLPLGIVGNKKQATAMKQVAKNLGSNDTFIIGDDTLVDSVKPFDINVPINPLDIYELKQKYLNECLSSLGIYSVDEKRERILEAEVSTQNQRTDYVYTEKLLENRRWIDEMNKRGCNIELVEPMVVHEDEEAKKLAHEEHMVAVADGTYKKNTETKEVTNNGDRV